ncbi:histidine phosphotransferase family protein [Defluviimonas aestuarii]|uniref:histidine phosphotransferase family protein n=1 Tax=Albidovulum aestuarii TaxID=1130726 RepID=UPI00249C9998|nr:histidine phosphotransferase family protein [Defluviimonas aestuarii]MDI3336029.1 histidine phosphotransferase family protein [Defluviimonas aestuarii]
MPLAPPDDLTALLGSRICHDLISPLGAIGNGVELLMMTGAAQGPEMALISESVTNASARIRFFRIAYGLASPGQPVARSEIRSILDDMTRGGRLCIDWQVAGDAPRPEVKLAFLALQCIETALPHGGRVIVTNAPVWRIEAKAEKLKVDPNLWARLDGSSPGTDISASHVQFALLPDEIRRSGRKLSVEIDSGHIAISY